MYYLPSVSCWENMLKRTVEKLPTVDGKCKRDLLWSLQPIFLWMQVLGIPSGQLQLSWVFRRYVVLIIGVTMMIWVVPSNIRSISSYIHTGQSLSKIKAIGLTFHGWITRFETVQEFQYLFLNVSISLSFVIVAHVQWRSTWKNAVKVEYAMRFDTTFYRSVRKISTAALVLLFLVNKLETEVYHIGNDWRLVF